MQPKVLFVLLFLCIVSAQAEIITRIGSGSWTEINQWSPAKIPDVVDDVIIPDDFFVDVISAVKIQSLWAAEMSRLTLKANFEVTSPIPGQAASLKSRGQVFIDGGASLISARGSEISRFYVTSGSTHFLFPFLNEL